MKIKKAIALGATSLMLVGIMSAPASAVPDPHKLKCNSGRGNGSELTDHHEDCDPGNSGGKNNGGD